MQTIHERIAETSLRFADKPALRHKTGPRWAEVTYRALHHQVEGAASGLRRWGIADGDRIALLAPSSPGWVVAYLGILRAGGIAVPIDKELKSVELRHILLDCEARLLFTATPFLDVLGDMAGELPALEKLVLLDPGEASRSPVAQEDLDALEAEWQRLKGVLPRSETARMDELTADLRRRLTEGPLPETNDAEDPNIGSGSSVSRLAPQSLAAFCCREPIPPSVRSAGETAVILYTSGTTGRSKGAMLSHRNILSNIEAAVERFRVDSSIHTLSFLPVNHVYEQVCGILLPLSIGGTVTFAESIKKLGQNLAEVRPNFLLGVPALFRLLVDRIQKSLEARPMARRLYRFPATRPLVARKIRQTLGDDPVFISGGAALDPEVAEALRGLGIAIYQGYGITETSPVIAFECPGEIRRGSVGRPMRGIEVRIDHPNEDGIGEIVVKGPNVMQGYFRNPGASREVLTDGWYRTGDLGRLDADGYLYICGREKNLIVTPNGKNVYPEEIEIELNKSPFIAESMVYGHKIAASVEEVHAVIYPDQEALDNYAGEKNLHPLSQKDVEGIIRHEVMEVGRRLSDYKRVKKFTLREEEFPKTTTRKIKRFAVEADIPADRN